MGGPIAYLVPGQSSVTAAAGVGGVEWGSRSSSSFDSCSSMLPSASWPMERSGYRGPMDVRSIAEAIGYPAAALGILIESTGVPFPGELTLVAVAPYAGAGHPNIVAVIFLAALGAVVGGDLGYFIGRKGGRPFIEKLLS